ncbi:acylphosphatase [candidate division KSB1 bacterium]|nr:acylphosphatase [candidate division KSB1 bacterium]
MKDVQAHIIITGTVQGVGYRFFASRLARQMGLTGWVKNSSSNQVEIQIEGARGLIEAFIKDLKTGNAYARVQDVQVEWRPFSGKYNTFDVTF